MTIDTSNWSSEFLRSRPGAVNAIVAGLDLLGTPNESRQVVAEDIYFACLTYGLPGELPKEFAQPQDIKAAIERIVRAADEIEDSLALLAKESQPLPANLGGRAEAIRYLHQEIVRAMYERLAPSHLTVDLSVSERYDHLPHRFSAHFVSPSSGDALHGWTGRFSVFANTVRSIASHAFSVIGDSGLRRAANKTDFNRVQLIHALGFIYSEQTGKKASASRLRNEHCDAAEIGDVTPLFVKFLMCIWPATKHSSVSIDTVQTSLKEARRFWPD